MTSTKTRTTALITPVGPEAQDEARTLAAEGRTAKAVRRLRKDSGLGLHTASAALDLLGRGHTLPTSYRQALESLRHLDAPLVDELTELLRGGGRDAAIKLLRERTDIDLAGGYHLVMELAADIGSA
ncbi:MULTISPECIES: hypothetical protein [Streptomyces]|uniref:hypothetical protein n=1 Tax=Streptomyces TaxID=1883 RepID=UPI00163D0131|nr:MULTISPECIES: hypothetical protein [Streptomyces]MBC2877586.1 hypothetical protein [Streptomyces sp. TYQ1024]UBI36175.1 hypothetical protein K7I03_06695 [Streptomyces mobaraensis]UKW28769.1 hypothetical protein MCU78_06680 [Streptomyces sp. TYQ1024]